MGDEHSEHLARIIETVALHGCHQTPTFPAILIIDWDGNIVFANITAGDIYGIKRSDIMGRNYNDPAWTYYSIDDKPLNDEELPFRRAIHSGKPAYSLEYKVKRSDGTSVIIRSNALIIRDPANDLIGVVQSMRDITESKEAERSLKESQQKYSKLIETANDAIFIADAESGLIIDANQRASELLDKPLKEIIGMHQADLHPKQEATRYMDAFKDYVLKGKGIAQDMYVQRADGTHVPVEISASVTELNGQHIVQGIFRDVTERKRAEDQLRAERNRAQKYLDIAGVLLVALDTKGKVSLINKKGIEMLGYPADQIIGKDWFDVFIPETIRKQTKQVFNRLMKGKLEPVENYENQILTSSGKKRMIAWHNSLLRDDQHHIIGTLSSGEDITERKQAEEALKASEEKLRGIVEHSTNLFYSHTPDHELTYVSPQSEKFFGYSPEKSLRKWTDFLSDSPINQKGFELTEKAISTGEVQQPYELELSVKGGRKVWVEVHEAPVVENGKTVAIVGALTDITERKRTEEALQETNTTLSTILQASPLPMVVVELNATVRMWNKAAEHIFGWKADEIVGKTLPTVPKDKMEEFWELQKHIASRSACTGIEFKRKTKKGKLLDVRLSASPLTDDKDNVWGIVEILEDITDEKRTAEILRDKDREIRRAYVDVFNAVTGGRLIIMTPDEIKSILGEPVTDKETLEAYKDLGGARDALKEAVLKAFPNSTSLDDISLAASEAMTNAVKHGGKGEFRIFKTKHHIQVAITDFGPGIDFSVLPKATLLSGFSTQQTLGVGFNIMLEVCNRVYLSTQPGNTTIVLEIRTRAESAEEEEARIAEMVLPGGLR